MFTESSDPWLKYLKRHPKGDQPEQGGSGGGNSAPRTPQEAYAMPYTVQMTSLETPPSGIISEEVVDHPLSPVQEHATEAIVSICSVQASVDRFIS